MFSAMKASFLLFIVAGLSRPSVGERDDFHDETYDELGVTAWLNCNNSTQFEFAPNDSIPVSWMLPDLTVLYGDEGKFQILNDNWTLQISNLSRDDLGLYHCMLRAPDVEWFLVSIGLNAGGPYFEDLWDKYWLNTVIALAAFFGFLLLAVLCYLLYRYRFIPPEDDDSQMFGSTSGRRRSEVRVVSIVDSNGVINSTFEMDQASPTSHRKSTSSSDETYSNDGSQTNF